MSILAYFVLPMAGSLFILLAEFYGMEQMGVDRGISRLKRWGVAGLFALSMVIASNLSLGANAVVNLLMLFLMPALGNRLYHSGRKHVIYYGILTIAVYLTDALAVLGVQSLVLYGVIVSGSAELLNMAVICFARILEFMVIRLVVYVVRKRGGMDIDFKEFIISFGFPVYSIFNVFVLLTCIQIYFTPEMIMLFLVNVLFLLALNIYFAVLLGNIGEREGLKRELALYRQQAEMQCSYYDQEEKKYEESRKIIHDIRNHMTAMESLYRDSEAHDAAEYAGEIHSMLNSLGQTYYTSDKLLNIILNDKVRMMRRLGIAEDIRVGEIDLAFMREVDVTTVFANLLDNGIEAAKRQQGGFIRLRVEQTRQFISVSMENGCKDRPLRAIGSGAFKSAKPGHKGLGLESIRHVAEAYDGDAQYEWKDGVFYTRILLVQNAGRVRP